MPTLQGVVAMSSRFIEPICQAYDSFLTDLIWCACCNSDTRAHPLPATTEEQLCAINVC